MKLGDLYNRHGKTYMIIEFLDRSWTEVSDDGMDLLTKTVSHVTCLSHDGFEEFPLDWFCQGAARIEPS